VAALGAPGVARAAEPGAARVLVWHCSDEALEGTGFPGCEATGKALRIEIGGSVLGIKEVYAEDARPADAERMARERGAIFVAWVEGREGGYVIYAYDALNDQVLSKSVEVEKGTAPPDAAEVAFLYRNMLGTSLYADLESIESDSGLWSLAFPEEKVQVVKEVEQLEPEPARVHLSLGYTLLSNPQRKKIEEWPAWHALSMGLGVRVHEIVAVALELGVTPVASPFTAKRDGVPLVKLKTFLVDVRASARVKVLDAGPFTLLPAAGVAMSVTVAEIEGGHISGNTQKSYPHGSAFVSLLMRLMMHRNVGFGLELGAEALFKRYTYGLEMEEGEVVTLLKMGWLGLFVRFGLVFAL
jgi:hypothetical protein